MNKKNLILLIILVVLVGVGAGYQYFWLPKKNITDQQVNWLAKVNLAEVDKIVIKKNGQTTTLSRDGERWRVVTDGQWYVNEALVDNFNQAWQRATISKMSLVSNNRDSKAELKTDGSGLKVQLLSKDNQLLDFYIGLSQSGHTYVSRSDTEASFEVAGDLLSVFDYAEWRDFNIFNSGSDKIKQIKITQGKNILTLKKENSDWQLTGNPKLKLNQDKVARIVSLLGDLSATSIPEQKAKDTGLDKKIWTVEATGEGIRNILIIGNEEMVNKKPGGNFFVKNAVSPNLYLLSKNLVGVFQVNPKDLVD